MNEESVVSTIDEVVMVPVVEDSGHCGDCPYLAPYEHPFFHYSAWCWKQMRSLDWYDYWLADCIDATPDSVLVKIRSSGNTEAP